MSSAEPVGLLHVLRRQQNRGAAADEVRDRLPHSVAAARVEPGRRLVEEQDLGLRDERSREVEATAHPARVRLGGPVGSLVEFELHQQLAGSLLRPLLAEVVQTTHHVEVLVTRSGARRPRRSAPTARSAPEPCPAPSATSSPADVGRCPRRARAASSGSGRPWSCRLRSGPAARARCPWGPRGRGRRAPSPRR